MKKPLLALVLISTFLVPSVSNAAVKAGGSCKKQGQTVVQDGKKYTCIVSKKKLIWDKGSPIPKPQSQSSGTTQPSTPAPQPTQIEQPLQVSAGQGCANIGEIKQNSTAKFECREIAGNARQWIQLSITPPAIVNTATSEDVNICKLQDLRTQKTPTQGIAFPLPNAAFSSLGTVRVGVIPFDFSDAPGESNLAEILATNKNKVDKWLAFNARGKQSYQWNIVNEWIRAPKTSEQYNWLNPGNPIGVQVQSEYESANQLFSAASSKIDLSQLDFIFLLFPNAQQGIGTEVSGRSRTVTTPKGNFVLSYFGAGKIFPDTNQPLWSVWIHEALHSQGLAMHAPGNGSPLHIGGNQSGASSNLSGWDQFISGWLDDSQIFCRQESKITNEQVTLASTDTADPGPKLAIIKISASEAIVVESRRKGEFSPGFPVGTYGLNAYVIQSAQNNERCDSCDQDAIEKKQFAYYLRADGVDRGMWNYPMSAPIRWSVFIRQGESVSFKGVKITLEKTGDYDTISITK